MVKTKFKMAKVGEVETMKKKVLVLNPYIPTLGGGEKHMGFLCQFMEEYFDDVSIDILVFNYNDIDINDENYVTISTINNQFNLHLTKTSIKKISKFDTNMDDYITNLSSRYDLFINFMIFSRHISKAKKNIYSCMFPPKPRLMECKDATGNITYKFKALLQDRKFLRSYDKFVANSEYSNHWFNEYWSSPKKSVVIYPPIFSEKDLVNRYVEEKKRNIIISVGRFFVDAHSKKQLEMVEFFVKHQDIFEKYEYHLVGAVSNYQKDLDYLEKIKQMANKVTNVFIHENCEYEVLMKLYKHAKIFWHATGYGVDGDLNPEKMEHFGITTVEAMSFGVVPVVINKGGQKESVEEDVNGYRWDTEEECIEKTRRLIENDKLRAKMALKSSLKAKKYSIEEYYRRNKEVFDELQI